MKRLLEIKKEKKAKQPKFIRHAAHRKPGLEEKWRKPKGLHNKLGDNKRGHGRQVNDGFRSPAAVRDLSKNGKKIFLINNKKDLQIAEPEIHDIIISGTLGNKKRLEIVEEAKKEGFTILNLNVDKKIAEIKDAVTKRSKIKTERETKKVELKKAAEKKATKKTVKKEKTADEKKKEELKEQNKILTKKE